MGRQRRSIGRPRTSPRSAGERQSPFGGFAALRELDLPRARSRPQPDLDELLRRRDYRIQAVGGNEKPGPRSRAKAKNLFERAIGAKVSDAATAHCRG